MADDSHSTLLFPPFHIPAGVDIVYRGDIVVPLEPRAVRVLRYLAEHRDRVVSKEELLDTVWPDVFTTDAVLKTAVLKIRRALGDREGNAPWIETHHRRGYRFVGDADTEADANRARPSTNLPQPTTRFIGREREVAAVHEALAIGRLVTLTGPGGIGKTRLALEAAAAMLPECGDGVWLVELGAVSEPFLVAHAVAATLGVRDVAGQDVVASVGQWLGKRDILLVLDNCEHLIEACAPLASTLLRSAAGLRVLATSREVLGVPGEAVRPVPPLPREEAVGLFVDRAGLSNPAFELTPDNAASVEVVCRELDGIPLALELAAARVSVLSAAQIAARLDDRFRLLGPFDRTAPARHRTLRGAIDWSHELLSEDEKVLFRRLSIFAGGWTLEAAEAVGRVSDVAFDGDVTARETLHEERADIVVVLSHLVDKSLVTVAGYNGDVRYGMLATLRQYAAEKLRDAGEEALLSAAHRGWVLERMRQLRPDRAYRILDERIRTTVFEYDNVRAALQSGLRSGGDVETAARLCNELGLFWQVRGHWAEGRRWLAVALACDAVTPPARAGLLYWAGTLAHEQGAFELARALLDQCLALRREEGDPTHIGAALHQLGHVAERMGHDDAADAYRTEFVSLMEEAGNPAGIAVATHGLGLSALRRGDYERAATWFAQGLAAFEANGDRINACVALHNLGEIALRRGELDRAVEMLERSVSAAREIGAPRVVAHSTHLLGYAAIEQGRPDEAVTLLLEALDVDEEQGDREGVAFVFEGLASVAATPDPERALRVAGAADALRESIGAPITDFDKEALGRTLDRAREALGDAEAADAFLAGRGMAFERALAYAREVKRD